VKEHHQHPRLRAVVASSLAVAAAGLETLLRAHPEIEIIVSSSGDTQLENVVRSTDPDVLILDVDEYELANGQIWDFISSLAAVMPILAVTASPSPAWIFRALQAGVRGFLPPGISGDELAAAVQALASGLVVFTPEFSEIMLPPPSQVNADEIVAPAEPLTPREQEVLAMVAEGLLNKEIADRLRISEHTVKFHISSIMGKLGASSRTEAVARGFRRGLVFL
jgi:NarL family two-component system response regulator YdfI